MYTIFYLNRAVFLSSKKIDGIKNIIINDKNDLCFNMRTWLEEETDYDINLYGLDPETLLSYLKEIYNYIEAAGGLVNNSKGEYLFIKRFGIWDLPKGKIEEGESPEKASIREVEEETGIKYVDITGNLPASYHIYPWKNNHTLKKTHWFRMKSDYNGKLIPQTKEDITEVVWLETVKAKKALESSYRSLKETLISFID